MPPLCGAVVMKHASEIDQDHCASVAASNLSASQTVWKEAGQGASKCPVRVRQASIDTDGGAPHHDVARQQVWLKPPIIFMFPSAPVFVRLMPFPAGAPTRGSECRELIQIHV